MASARIKVGCKNRILQQIKNVAKFHMKRSKIIYRDYHVLNSKHFDIALFVRLVRIQGKT